MIICKFMDGLYLIKKRRVALGVTQKELSKLCGVSQSMIAKIEAGRCEASYNIACRIFGALDSLVDVDKIRVKDFMEKGLKSCSVNDDVKSVIGKMKKKGISQMPVFDDGEIVGLVSESVLVENIDRLGSISCVGEIMVDAPPVVSEMTSKESVVLLLREFPMVLVRKGKDFVGLVCKADVLRRV